MQTINRITIYCKEVRHPFSQPLQPGEFLCQFEKMEFVSGDTKSLKQQPSCSRSFPYSSHFNQATIAAILAIVRRAASSDDRRRRPSALPAQRPRPLRRPTVRCWRA